MQPGADDLKALEARQDPRLITARNFDVGDNVVYPHHGAGVVMKKEPKELLGEERRDYLTIKILHNQKLRILFIMHGLDRIGKNSGINMNSGFLVDELGCVHG